MAINPPVVTQPAQSTQEALTPTVAPPVNQTGGALAAKPSQIAGNCVDLPRKLNSIVTHFEVCGQMDGSGSMQIATIHIFQRPEEAGFERMADRFLTVTKQTSAPLNNPASLVVEDMNYDALDDFRVIENMPAGPTVSYLYYLFDSISGQFVYSEAYHAITSPEFPGEFEIKSQWRESAAKWGVDTYVMFEGLPSLAKRETWEAVDAGTVRHIIKTAAFPNSTPDTVTLDETVAVDPQFPPSTGTTIQHQVADGEWLWQIARCYGADLIDVIQANPQIYNPDLIPANTSVTVPNVGSVGSNYGPPCVVTHTVQAGDTWNSIAQQYNADLDVLHRVNWWSALAVGDGLKVPRNSASPAGRAASISGKVQVGAQSVMGGKAGTALGIPVRFEASSPLAGITGMRVKQISSGGCLSADEMNDAPWETYVAEKTYPYTPPINWSTFKLHVQYRDAQGSLSPVYCGEVAVEGMP